MVNKDVYIKAWTPHLLA